MSADGGLEPAAQQAVYVVRGEVSSDAITNSLRALLRTRHHAITRHRFTLLDTVDGRVRRAGARLTHAGTNGSSTVAWQLRGERPPLVARLTRPPDFAWDLPKGALQDALAPVIGVRRLLAQADAESHGSMLDILDDRRKTVARLRIESGHVRRPLPRTAWLPLPTILTLTGLRGYDAAYERLKPVIESRPGVACCPDGLESVILQHAGVSESTDLPSLEIALAPDVRAEAGARQIHRALVAILTANEPGLREDIDTEFLHDFRVALRRTRALIRQLKLVFPADVVEHFSTEFSWLGKLTGPSRDLDVLVLALRAQALEMPAADVDVLIAFLKDAQDQERERLIEALDSARYRTLLTDWQRMLERPIPSAAAPAATLRLADVVADRAWRLSKRLAQRATTIDQRTDPAELHEIRITAKKLRYLIDVTSSFYDSEDLDYVLSALKKLQRVLGDLNDAQVQEMRLLDLARRLGDSNGPASAVLALGQLAERSRHRRDRLRPEAVDHLQQFRARAVRAACRRAFKRERPGEPAR